MVTTRKANREAILFKNGNNLKEMIEAKYKQGQKIPSSVKCEDAAAVSFSINDVVAAENKMLQSSFENAKFDNKVFQQPAAQMINSFLKTYQGSKRHEPKTKIECTTWLWEQQKSHRLFNFSEGYRVLPDST